MKEIPLTKGKVAIVDDDDFEYLSKFRWYVDARGYAVHKRKEIVYMHRLISKTPKGLETDHINGNKLDNRKENLRHCTKSENMRNRGKQTNNKSGYKGVSWHLRAKKWLAHIVINRKSIHLGLFDDPEEASKTYRKAEKEMFGEFARKDETD